MTESRPVSPLNRLDSSSPPLHPTAARFASRFGELLFALAFIVVFLVATAFLTLTILVGIGSFPRVTHNMHAICIVINHTVREACSESFGTGYLRAFVFDIFAHNASQSQTFDTVPPWYISKAAAIAALPSLLPIGSNWSCVYDPKTLELSANDLDQYLILAWAILGVVLLILILTIICYCCKACRVSPSPSSIQTSSYLRPQTYLVLRDET